MHLDGTAVADERIGQHGKGLHVRTEQDRFSSQSRFSRILAAVRKQAFRDKSKGRHAVPVTEFARGIDQQTIEKWIGCRQLTPKRHMEPNSFELTDNFGGAFGMARRENQKKIDKIAFQSAEDFGNDFFFAAVSATAKNHGAFLQTKTLEDLERQFRIDLNVLRIVLDAADVMNFFRFQAQSDPALDIFDILNANRVEHSKDWRDNAAEHAESFLRPRRQSRINEDDRNFPGVRFGHEIWPDLGFDQDDYFRVNHAECETHDRPKIERAVH